MNEKTIDVMLTLMTPATMASLIFDIDEIVYDLDDFETELRDKAHKLLVANVGVSEAARLIDQACISN